VKINTARGATPPHPLEQTRTVRAESLQRAAKIPLKEMPINSRIENDSEVIDHARVEAIRNAIKEGKLNINPEKIAQALIDNTRAFLGE
jgi:negative regulator of flagellin synthesis FlgM